MAAKEREIGGAPPLPVSSFPSCTAAVAIGSCRKVDGVALPGASERASEDAAAPGATRSHSPPCTSLSCSWGALR